MTCIYIIRYTASVVMAMANSFFGRSTPLKICRAMHLALSDLDLWTFALKFRLPVNFLTWLNCRRSLTVATFFAFDLTMTTDGRTPGCNAWCRLPAEQRITITSCESHNFLFFYCFYVYLRVRLLRVPVLNKERIFTWYWYPRPIATCNDTSRQSKWRIHNRNKHVSTVSLGLPRGQDIGVYLSRCTLTLDVLCGEDSTSPCSVIL